MKKIIPFLFLVILLFSCNSKKDEKLFVGLIKPSLNHLPFDIGLEIGTLDHQDFIIKYFSSGWETNEALVSEKIDVAIMPFTYIWTDISRGKKVKIISFFERESDGIICKKNIKNINELNGKKIGVLRASTLDIFAEIFIENNNVKMELVYFRTPMDMASALQVGEVDALSFYVPSIFKFDDNFKIIYWYSDDFPLHPCCDIAATEIALQIKLPLIKKFLAGLQKSISEMEKSPEMAIETACTLFSISRENSIKSLIHTKYLMNLDEEYQAFERKAIDKMIEKNYIETKVKDVYFKIE